MKLSPPEVERFYHIWWPLLNYVNVKRQLVSDFSPSPEEGAVDPRDARKIRDALWESESLREAFINENPANLPSADLDLVASWRYRVAGEFFIFRHLKKHTIFLHKKDGFPQAYGVLGLVSAIDEIIYMQPPVLVDAVLLPFEDKIIYDGLLVPYSVRFGGGIKSGLKDDYRQVQERGGVITTLRPLNADETLDAVRNGNKKALAAFRKELTASGLSLKMVEQHAGQIETFIEHSLLAQNPPCPLSEISVANLRTYLARKGGKANPVSFKRLVRFLLNSGRIDWEDGQAMQDLLKQTGRK
ncbi:MAG: hypothetical protein GY862_21165 [Gammaproteobacteria bacterium]|nr:hypothetical protein [Gammaproteobacteria bacterium]